MNCKNDNDILSVIIGADILPNVNTEVFFEKGQVIELVGKEINTILNDVDFRIFNLEGPLTAEERSILKDGPSLKASPQSIQGIKAMNIDLCLLANNHILDYGSKGAQDTLDILESCNIDYIGIGTNISERKKSYVIKKIDMKVAVYNCCEHEYSIKPEGELGCNEYDPLRCFDDVRELKKENDFVIVLYHGGKEFLRYPSPMLQRVFRKFSDCGADIVIAQHTHCIGSYEIYNNSFLLYGQGNFVFGRKNDEFYNSGLLVQLKFDKEMGVSRMLIPFVKDTNGVRIASVEEKEKLLAELEERSKRLANSSFLEEEYKRSAEKYLSNYIMVLHGNTFLERVLRKIFGIKMGKYLLKKVYPYRLLASLYNYITCEAHVELLRCGLKQLLDNQEE